MATAFFCSLFRSGCNRVRITFLFFGLALMVLTGALPAQAQEMTIPLIGCSTSLGQYYTRWTSDNPNYYQGAGLVVSPASYLDPSLTAFIDQNCNWACSVYGVSPTWNYIIEENNAPNAMALPLRRSDSAPDGTVFLGINLIQLELTPQNGGGWGLQSVVGHEFCHLIQGKNGFPFPHTMWAELHADFMAGWFVGGMSRIQSKANPFEAMRSIFNKGDTLYFDPGHHGTSSERGNAFIAGYNCYASGNSTNAAAYEQGLQYIAMLGAR